MREARLRAIIGRQRPSCLVSSLREEGDAKRFRGYPKTFERIVGAQTCCAHVGKRDKIAPLPITEGIMSQRDFRLASNQASTQIRALVLRPE